MADTNFSNEQMLKLYESMLRIRKVEEQLTEIAKRKHTWRGPPLHRSRGCC